LATKTVQVSVVLRWLGGKECRIRTRILLKFNLRDFLNFEGDLQVWTNIAS